MVGFDIRFNLIFRSSYLLNFIFLVIRVGYTYMLSYPFCIVAAALAGCRPHQHDVNATGSSSWV